MAKEYPGKILAQKVADAGYKTYAAFLVAFRKKTGVTLGQSTFSAYLHGDTPSRERFDAITNFLKFSVKEKQQLEDMYGKDFSSHTPHHPTPNQSRRVGAKYHRKKKAERIPIPRKPGVRISTKKKPDSFGRKDKPVPKPTRFSALITATKGILGKRRLSKRQMVLIFELSLG